MNRLFLSLGAAGLLGLGLFLPSACTQVKCGAGTVEKNGECVAPVTVTPTLCTGDTIPDPNGPGCIPKYACGAEGTFTERSDAGVCVGRGGGGMAGGCEEPLSCPAQNPNEYCVFGRVSLFTSDNSPPFMRTNVGTMSMTCGVDGKPACPCVKIYNPTAFVVGDRTPLGTRQGADNAPEASLDECGRWILHKVPRTTTGFIAAAVDDCDGSGADAWAFTAVGGEQLADPKIDLHAERNTVVIEKSLSDMWVQQAGRDLFGTGGSYIAIFRGGPMQSVPVQGVRPTAPATGYINASNTIYFGNDLTTLDPQRAFDMGTGMSGAVLINPPEVTNHSAMGGGINWEDVLGGSADGAYFVHRFRIR